MKYKHIHITDGAKEELRRATINGDKLNFQGQLKNYAELKKLFIPLGITWHKGEKQHYIEGSTPQKIQEILGGAQIVDEKKTLQSFYTPLNLVAKIVQLAGVNGKYCLEPSCGDGRILKEILVQGGSAYGQDINKNADLSGIEYPKLICLAKEKKKVLNFVLGEDFLKYTSDEAHFDRVIMNPPYDKNTWIKHIEHAWKFLKDGGRLVAICPNAQHNRFFQKFIKGKDYSIEEIEAGAFAESGTQIATMIVVINK